MPDHGDGLAAELAEVTRERDAALASRNFLAAKLNSEAASAEGWRRTAVAARATIERVRALAEASRAEARPGGRTDVDHIAPSDILAALDGEPAGSEASDG